MASGRVISCWGNPFCAERCRLPDDVHAQIKALNRQKGDYHQIAMVADWWFTVLDGEVIGACSQHKESCFKPAEAAPAPAQERSN